MTSKLTRDIIQSEIADFFAGVVEIHTELGGPNSVEEAQNQLTERVLACVPAVDSEPVFFIEVEGDDWINAGRIEGKNRQDLGLLPDGINYLYAAPQPAPVVPPMQHWEELCRQYPDMSIRDAIIRAAWWNHCRAAMLQAGNSPAHSGLRPEQIGVSPAQDHGWIPVSERMPTKQEGSVFLTWNGQYIGKELFLMGSFQCLKPEIITHWMPLPAVPQEAK
ncbi:DUF551 domain-containing protein [Raoultella planticola]|uniref:DUF551 domain-containing protein n=1 Tax=Raoultella planticola TaxID=575 RepID=A0A485A5N0_RAOPL|nr:DUF551 domain-containing protein [Raoultella planticola]KFD04278.1 hypothetical protein GRPL_04300 [Raoultella planticola ATCC 33531]VFS56094.1 Uncharacterised protein [Raoultella planticola]